jgi:chromosome segregation ATPase
VSIDDDILRLKRELESIQVRKIETATRLQTLESEKAQLLEECKALGVDPKGIEAAIQQQEEELSKEVKDIKAQLEQFNAFRS